MRLSKLEYYRDIGHGILDAQRPPSKQWDFQWSPLNKVPNQLKWNTLKIPHRRKISKSQQGSKTLRLLSSSWLQSWREWQMLMQCSTGTWANCLDFFFLFCMSSPFIHIATPDFSACQAALDWSCSAATGFFFSFNCQKMLLKSGGRRSQDGVPPYDVFTYMERQRLIFQGCERLTVTQQHPDGYCAPKWWYFLKLKLCCFWVFVLSTQRLSSFGHNKISIIKKKSLKKVVIK